MRAEHYRLLPVQWEGGPYLPMNDNPPQNSNITWNPAVFPAADTISINTMQLTQFKAQRLGINAPLLLSPDTADTPAVVDIDNHKVIAYLGLSGEQALPPQQYAHTIETSLRNSLASAVSQNWQLKAQGELLPLKASVALSLVPLLQNVMMQAAANGSEFRVDSTLQAIVRCATTFELSYAFLHGLFYFRKNMINKISSYGITLREDLLSEKWTDIAQSLFPVDTYRYLIAPLIALAVMPTVVVPTAVSTKHSFISAR